MTTANVRDAIRSYGDDVRVGGRAYGDDVGADGRSYGDADGLWRRARLWRQAASTTRTTQSMQLDIVLSLGMCR